MGVDLTQPVAMRRAAFCVRCRANMCVGAKSGHQAGLAYSNRPDVLLVSRAGGLLLVAKCGGGQGLHHVQSRFGPGDDVPGMRAERHSSVHGDPQDLCGRVYRDDGAPQGDHRLLPELSCMGGEEGDGGLLCRDLHPIVCEPVFQLVDVALEVFRATSTLWCWETIVRSSA